MNNEFHYRPRKKSRPKFLATTWPRIKTCISSRGWVASFALFQQLFTHPGSIQNELPTFQNHHGLPIWFESATETFPPIHTSRRTMMMTLRNWCEYWDDTLFIFGCDLLYLKRDTLSLLPGFLEYVNDRSSNLFWLESKTAASGPALTPYSEKEANKVFMCINHLRGQRWQRPSVHDTI